MPYNMWLIKMYYFCTLKRQNYIVPWCNGNTDDSGSFIPSSNLGGITSYSRGIK